MTYDKYKGFIPSGLQIFLSFLFSSKEKNNNRNFITYKLKILTISHPISL